MTEQYPQFLPAQFKLVEALEAGKQPQQAVQVLERLAGLYPDNADVLKAKITRLAKTGRRLDASIAARQFALLYPTHPLAAEFTQLADRELKQFQGELRSRLRGRMIAGALLGAAGFALTGNLYGPLSTVESSVMMMRGESAIGQSIAKRAQNRLPMLKDPEVLAYVNELGQTLAKATGRTDFQFEFYVILEDELNAFALPGGKIFINAGAIARSNSEAELAGLLAHEIAHAVMSHGFQMMTGGNLTANLLQFVPYGGTLTDLLVLRYSRAMEEQADHLGTHLLHVTGYAADGLRNLMQTLANQEKDRLPSWLSSHPETRDRVRYLERLIQDRSYNRYAFEGVDRHAAIQTKVKALLAEHEQKEAAKRKK